MLRETSNRNGALRHRNMACEFIEKHKIVEPGRFNLTTLIYESSGDTPEQPPRRLALIICILLNVGCPGASPIASYKDFVYLRVRSGRYIPAHRIRQTALAPVSR